MFKSNKLLILLMSLTLIVTAVSAVSAASGLDGVGAEVNDVEDKTEEGQVKVIDNIEEIEEQETEVKEKSNKEEKGREEKDKEETANAIGDMFKEASIKQESIKEVNEFIRPFALIMNKVAAGILGLTSLAMMLITVLDLTYIAVPFIRDFLDGGVRGANQMQGQAGMGGMNSMGGMGGSRYGGSRYGGMGGGMQGGMNQQANQLGGGLSAIGRLVSDEAIASTLETQGGGMGASSANGSVKSMIGSYMKKRAFFLIMFGVCAILFTSTIFTDIGVRLGTWILGLLMGVRI